MTNIRQRDKGGSRETGGNDSNVGRTPVLRPIESAARLDATWERKKRARDGCEIVLGHRKNGTTSFEL